MTATKTDYLASAVDPLLTAGESATLLGISMPTFWRRVRDKTITPPVRLGNMSRWPRSEILAVIDKAKASRFCTTAA